MTQGFLPTLKTETAEEGFHLAIKLSRLAVKFTQPDEAVRARLRSVYEADANALIASSHVVATHFQTIAAANRHWID